MILIIAQYTQTFESEANSRFTEIAQKLSEKYNVELVTSRFSHSLKRNKEPKVFPKGYKVTFLESYPYKRNVSLQRIWNNITFAKSLESYLNSREDIELIYCAVPSINTGNIVSRFCKKNKIEYILDIQDLWPEAFKMVFNPPVIGKLLYAPMKRKINEVYRGTKHIIAVSQTYLDRATKEIAHIADDQLVAYLGTSLKRFDELTDNERNITEAQGKIIIAYIGTLSFSYDLRTVIQAIKKIELQTEVPVKLLVMGDGIKRNEFEECAKESKIDFEFTGMLPYGEMAKCLVKCDIAVNPIVKGSAGSVINKVCDYAAAALPVVNTQECEEYRKLLIDYNCGINCAVGSADEVAEALLKLINNKKLRKEMGQNSRKLAEEKFDRDYTYKEIEDFLDRIYESSDNKQ